MHSFLFSQVPLQTRKKTSTVLSKHKKIWFINFEKYRKQFRSSTNQNEGQTFFWTVVHVRVIRIIPYTLRTFGISSAFYFSTRTHFNLHFNYICVPWWFTLSWLKMPMGVDCEPAESRKNRDSQVGKAGRFESPSSAIQPARGIANSSLGTTIPSESRVSARIARMYRWREFIRKLMGMVKYRNQASGRVWMNVVSARGKSRFILFPIFVGTPACSTRAGSFCNKLVSREFRIYIIAPRER